MAYKTGECDGGILWGDGRPTILEGAVNVLQPKGDPRFHALLKEISDLHDRKSSDYATVADPYANVRGASDWNIPQWVGAMIRATDKVKRLQKYARSGSLTNENAEDAFMDLAVYALIALILHREEVGQHETC